VVIVQEKNMFL